MNALTLERFPTSLRTGVSVLFGLVFFFVVCCGASDSIRMAVMLCAMVSLLVIALRFKTLRDRINLPFIALTLYVLMDGISTFYSVSGKFALREFLKVFFAYLLAVILLATSPKKEETTGKRIATVLAVCAAFGSLLSVDLYTSTRIISRVVLWVLDRFTNGYAEFSELQTSSRMSSIFSNSNVFVGVAGLGMLFSLGLTDTSSSRKERFFYLTLLYLNALGFLLTISLGGLAFGFVALFAFVLFHSRKSRIRALVLVLETIALAAAVTALIYKLQLWTKSERDIVPFLYMLAGLAAVFVIDFFVGQKVSEKAHTQGKIAEIIGAAALVLIVAYAVAALSFTVPVTMKAGGTITRITLFPKPGTYSLDLSAENADSLKVTVRSQSWKESARNKSEKLYSGAVQGAGFTVPEGSVIVYFRFSAPDGAVITSARYGNYRIPLLYRMLPGFIRNRLANVHTYQDVSLRVVYFEDGFKLFLRSPVVGLGMGAFENAIKSVQSFYYETKYAHNHYFQTMLETGIVGLLLFLSLLISSAIAICKSGKEHPYVPILGAALVFMAGQAMSDIVFSAYAYLPMACGTFTLINLCCGGTIKKPVLTRPVRSVILAVISGCTVIYCGFLAGNMYAKKLVKENPTLESLTKASRMDKFEWADYALSYVMGIMDYDVTYEERQQADQYAQRLAEVNSNTIPIYLAQYYFSTSRTEQGFAMLEKSVDYVASDQSAWQRAFALLQTYDDGSQAFRDETLLLTEKLNTWNEENIGNIKLDDAE